jgi:hypothetical protein
MGQRRNTISATPAFAAELPTGAKAARARHALTAKELDQSLAELVGHPWQVMYALMARVGLRPGEAAGVCGDALELDSKPPTVAVLRAVHLDNGPPVLTDKLKTAGERGTLAIPADLAASLGALAIRPG